LPVIQNRRWAKARLRRAHRSTGHPLRVEMRLFSGAGKKMRR
jgi:hypothetical protein